MNARREFPLWPVLGVVTAVLAVLRVVLLLVREPDAVRGVVVLVLAPAVAAVVALVVVLMSTARRRAEARVRALRARRPGTLVLSCLVQQASGPAVDDMPGERNGRRLLNAYAALVADRDGLALYRGARDPRLARSIPASAIVAVRSDRALAGPYRRVPSIIVEVMTPSGSVDLPIQLAEWHRTLFPRFGDEEHVAAAADEVRRALGPHGASAPTGSTPG